MPLPLLLALASAHARFCNVENAHYALRTQPSVTASFRDVDSGRDWPSGLAMRLHIGATGRSFWFLPWNGGSSGSQHLASTEDVTKRGWHPPDPDGGPRPIGDLEFIATDKGYDLWDHVPVRGEIAPAHLLIPDLANVLSHQLPSGRGASTVRQFFDLADCRRRS